jgi:hypothetical protein
MKRRTALLGLGSVALATDAAFAFGDSGSFHPRLLVTAGAKVSGPRRQAPGRWSWELIRRTSAPARLITGQIAADDPKLLKEPFLVWAGDAPVKPLSAPEIRGLRRFLTLGGVLFVDDSAPETGVFAESAKVQMKRVLLDVPILPLDPKHVLYKSYYLVDRPVGRLLGKPHLDAMVRGRTAQVFFSSHDLLGALARDESETWAFEVAGGATQRQSAIRMAVNIAMYVLCSDYKDDQVHAEELMRRRGRRGQ